MGARLNAILPALIIAALLAVTIERLWLGQGLPLWLDETWTAVIVGQDSWGAFWREVWLDCNAPLYYFVMWLWQGLAGNSNWALRLPSIAFISLAAVLPIFWRAKLDRTTALIWVALLCLWWPGLAISLDARAYALLFLISVAQTIAYANLLDRPDLKRAFVWSTLAALAILTHYYALYVVAVQGVMFLALRRQWRTWPAALVFVPVFAWIAFHLPRVAEYARPDVAWYTAVTFETAWSQVAYVIGPLTPVFVAIVGLIVIYGLVRNFDRSGPWLVVLSGVLALAVALAVGVIKPSLTQRYLTPMAPLVLLGVAMSVRRSPMAALLLVSLYFAAAMTPDAHRNRLAHRAGYGYERASDFLMQAKPTHLVFLWDHPAAKILDRGSLRQIGGFFFDRAGMDTRTTPLVLDPSDDPTASLMKAATGDRPAVLWVYNTGRKSAARDHPPRFDEIAPDWRCKTTTDGMIGIVACAPNRLFD